VTLRNQQRRIRIERPGADGREAKNMAEEVRKFARLIPSEPEPNMGRVMEIKEEIAKGTYLTQEKIDETIARITLRLMRSE